MGLRGGIGLNRGEMGSGMMSGCYREGPGRRAVGFRHVLRE